MTKSHTLEYYLSQEIGDDTHKTTNLSTYIFYLARKLQRIHVEEGLEAARQKLEEHRRKKYENLINYFERNTDKLEEIREKNAIRASNRYWEMRKTDTSLPKRLGRPRKILI